MDAPLYTGFDRERSVSFRINAFSNAARVILLYSDATRENVCVWFLNIPASYRIMELDE